MSDVQALVPLFVFDADGYLLRIDALEGLNSLEPNDVRNGSEYRAFDAFAREVGFRVERAGRREFVVIDSVGATDESAFRGCLRECPNLTAPVDRLAIKDLALSALVSAIGSDYP